MSKKDETQPQQSFKAQVQQDIESWLALVERQTTRWQETVEDVAKASVASMSATVSTRWSRAVRLGMS